MIKFDLVRALAGDKVITRNGREVSELHLFNTHEGERPLYCVIDGRLQSFTVDGLLAGKRRKRGEDLFMAPKKLSGFINIYPNKCTPSPVHPTREEADSHANKSKRIACIDLSQFEEGRGL